MSQLTTIPDFAETCACSAPVPPRPSPPPNPTVYYSIAKGTPAQQGLRPNNPSLPAIAVEQNGAGPLYVWNPQTITWN